jgi:hypothetical protein
MRAKVAGLCSVNRTRQQKAWLNSSAAQANNLLNNAPLDSLFWLRAVNLIPPTSACLIPGPLSCLLMKPFQLLLLGSALLVGHTSSAQGPSAPVVLTDAPTAPAGLREKLVRADSALAEPLQQARRTLTQVRKRYTAGLANGEKCLVMVRVQASDTSFRQVQARVIGWRNGAVQALISPTPKATVADLRPVSFPETAVLDWTILQPNGRQEGNFIGRYLDMARQMESMLFR